MLAIGGAAGAASFTHVRDVAAAHGQPGWLAWADAIVLELMSVASGLELRRRKRAGVSVVFPVTVLACAVTLSLAAQVVEAEPSPIGWIAAAVPALGFLVMVKIALGYTAASPPVRANIETSTAEPADQSTTVIPAVTDADRDSRSTPPDLDRRLNARTVHDPGNHQDRPEPDRSRTGGPVQRRRSSRRGPSAHPTGTDELLAVARRVREQRAAEGKPLTRAALAAALRSTGHTVSNTRASHLLKILKADQPAPPSSHDQQAGEAADDSPPPTPPAAPTPTNSLASHQGQPQSGEPTT